MNAWAFYGSCDELKRGLIRLQQTKKYIKFYPTKRHHLIKIAQYVSPYMAAEINKCIETNEIFDSMRFSIIVPAYNVAEYICRESCRSVGEVV